MRERCLSRCLAEVKSLWRRLDCFKQALAARASCTASGRAAEAHSSRPKGSAMTCTFIPCYLCLPE